MPELAAADVAQRIVLALKWERTRCQSFGLSQERIVDEHNGRWLGINTSASGPIVLLHAGRILADGTYTTPEAESGPLDGFDTASLASAAGALWQTPNDVKTL